MSANRPGLCYENQPPPPVSVAWIIATTVVAIGVSVATTVVAIVVAVVRCGVAVPRVKATAVKYVCVWIWLRVRIRRWIWLRVIRLCRPVADDDDDLGLGVAWHRHERGNHQHRSRERSNKCVSHYASCYRPPKPLNATPKPIRAA